MTAPSASSRIPTCSIRIRRPSSRSFGSSTASIATTGRATSSYRLRLPSTMRLQAGPSPKMCRTFVAQGPSDNIDDLDQNLAGLAFEHPVDIGDQWQEIKCTGCHTVEEGY